MRTLPLDYAARNLARSPRRLAAIVLGNALVVLLVVAAAAFVSGMRAALAPRGASANVLLLGVGIEESLERSAIAPNVASIVAASVPGIRAVGGVPFVSPEVVAMLIVHAADDPATERRASVRGVTPAAFLVHERVQLTDGRAPRPGHGEVIVGSLAAERLGLRDADLALGRTLLVDGASWTIVGRFRAGGSVMDAELWAPLADVQLVARRDTVSCVVVTLGAADVEDLAAFATMRLDLEVTALPEDAYYAGLLAFYRPIRIMVWFTAVLVALAGILGGLNTLYAAFASRVRELGMLRSLGYSRRAILLSLVEESLLASSVALFLALALAWAALDGIAVSFSLGVFRLALDPVVLAFATGAAIFLGLLGAIPPAVRCLRLPIPEALKAH